jgi:hypothetical protein
MKIPVFLLFAAIHSVAYSQSITQTVRGSVVEKHLQQTLPGANVIILHTSPLLGATADEKGNFRISNVPVGTYTLQVTYLGFEPRVIPNVIVSSGKEVVVTIEMEEQVIEGQEVVVTADDRKDQPLNEMSAVSTRTFSVEETQRYAAAVNDPARMAVSYAGVVSADDGNNTISIRGNSPNGLLWRMEGIEIPNPNHFSFVGSSGGGISILNAQLLSNSDFMTGAFAAEYGDALSGVFDLRLRKGNNEKMEFTGQAGFLGLSGAVEGPFSKNYDGSYLVNYRFSTLTVLSKLGVLGDESTTDFQDLSYHIFLPTQKAGYFTLFGFGGLSDQKYHVINDSLQWEHFYDRYGGNYESNTGVAGFTHSYLFGSKAYLKSALSLSTTQNGETGTYADDSYNPLTVYYSSYRQRKQTLSSVLNYKFDARLSLRSGAIITRWQYDLLNREAEDPGDPLITYIDQKGTTFLTQLYSQAQYRFSESTTLNGGLHYQILWLNHSQSLEPRLSVEHHLNDRHTLSAGYGLHSQSQPIGVYFAEVAEGDQFIQPNRELGFSRAHHVVLSYHYLITPDFRIKTEVYYQSLFDVPVSADSATSFSLINSWGGFVTGALVNEGNGTNYGLELTVEKFLSDRYYFLLSSSLFQSKYEGSDGIERNTRWNSGFNGTFTGGKEFVLSKNSDRTLLGFNLKAIYAGGFWQTPVDVQASQQAKETIYDESRAYSIQNPDYFRLDAGMSLKLNRQKLTSTFLLDIQNVTNRQNVFGQYYESTEGEVVTYYSTPLIPVLSYRIEF